MRFTVAARLLAQLEESSRNPSAVTTENHSHLGVSDNDLLLPDVPGEHYALYAQNKKREDGGEASGNTRARLSERLAGKTAWEGVLRNEMSIGSNKNDKGDTSRPCDPTSNEADVGILSCGFGYYCAESQESPHGGVCTELEFDSTTGRTISRSGNRWLADETDVGYYLPLVCNEPGFAEKYNWDCDCSNFDLVTSTGDVSCVQGEQYCLAPCSSACAQLLVSGTVSATGTSYAICYDLIGSYNRLACYGATEDGGCSIVIDGVTCSSCEEVTCIDNSKQLAWDCTNVPKGTQGNVCSGDFILPIMEEIDPCVQAGYLSPALLQNETTRVNTWIKIEPQFSGIVKVKVKSWPRNGALSVQDDGTVIYNPNTNFVGSDVFKIDICDAAEHCKTLMIIMEVLDESEDGGRGGALYGLVALVAIPLAAWFVFYKRSKCGKNKVHQESTLPTVEPAREGTRQPSRFAGSQDLSTQIAVPAPESVERPDRVGEQLGKTNAYLPNVKDQCRTSPAERPPVAEAVLIDSPPSR